MNAKKSFNFVMAVVFLVSLVGIPGTALAQEPTPIIWGVTVSSNRISGLHWPNNAEIQINVDNPITPQYPDWTTTKTTNPDGNFYLYAQYDIEVGFVVAVTDGNVTKQVTVSSFEVTDFDASTWTVSGIGTPNANAAIWILNPEGYTSFVVDPTGHWQVDLTGVVDATNKTWGFAIEQDAEGDGTQSKWPAPTVRAVIDRPHHSVQGYDWMLGIPITLTIDNPGNGAGMDYTDVQLANFIEEYDSVQVQFDLGDFRMETGALVTMTDGAAVQNYSVAYLDITNVDTATESVFGNADPGSTVYVQFRNSSGFVNRAVVADQFGNWLADFSTPGPGNDEQSLFDIQPGKGFSTFQYDNNGNSTRLYWFVPEYKVVAYPDEDVIAATEFWPGSTVTITLDDPANGAGVDLTRTGVVDTETGGWNCQTWWGFCYVLDLWGEFDVQPGQFITITDGTRTISYVVAPIWITRVDNERSTVSGIANPYSDVYLDTWPCAAGLRHIVADANGNWFEDFSIPGDEEFEQEICDFTTEPFTGIAYERSGEGETWVGWVDADADGISDIIDNAPTIFNPDQLDVDNDGIADVLDPCPGDSANTCNVAGSAAGVIGVNGGTLYTSNLKVSFNIPANALSEYISFSITDLGGGYELASDQGSMMVVHTYSIQPNGTQFDPPASITFRWDDGDNNGIVDDTSIQEAELLLVKDGIVITPACSASPGCNMTLNELVVEISSLSQFALAVPLNQPPQIDTIAAPIAPVQLGQSLNATVEFSDPDIGDTHTLLWDWGDDTTTTVSTTVPSVTTSHTYTSAGVYTITATITDSAGESDTETIQYVVIYDPNGGYVTGGGWINSPEGAYTPDPTLTGKATFGFVSKYQKGANVPTGNTEFQFKVADLNFKSTSYDWLVVAGSKAQYKGIGTINGAGEYGFMLTAIDGSPDKFRIKIWDKVTNEVIYDNMLGMSDTADPTTAVQGGSIIIHKTK